MPSTGCLKILRLFCDLKMETVTEPDFSSATLFPSCPFWPLPSTPRFNVLKCRFNERPFTFFEKNEGNSAPGCTRARPQRNSGREAGVGSGIRLPEGNICCQLVASEGKGDDPLYRSGASEGIRTLDTHVGNVMLYQAELRSLPAQARQITGI